MRRLKSVGSEVDVIKSQQEEFAAFRQQVVEPIARGVDEVNRLGSGLIQSAAGGVNTTSLEKDLEKVNDKWNTLKDKVTDEKNLNFCAKVFHSTLVLCLKIGCWLTKCLNIL